MRGYRITFGSPPVLECQAARDAERAFEECLSRGGHWLQSAQINLWISLSLALARV